MFSSSMFQVETFQWLNSSQCYKPNNTFHDVDSSMAEYSKPWTVRVGRQERTIAHFLTQFGCLLDAKSARGAFLAISWNSEVLRSFGSLQIEWEYTLRSSLCLSHVQRAPFTMDARSQSVSSGSRCALIPDYAPESTVWTKQIFFQSKRFQCVSLMFKELQIMLRSHQDDCPLLLVALFLACVCEIISLKWTMCNPNAPNHLVTH